MLLVLALVFTQLDMLYAQSSSAASITALQGRVSVQRAAGTLSVGQVGQTIAIGDRIITGPGSLATITLGDGSQIGLSESTTLLIADDQVDAKGIRVRTEIDLFGGLVRSLVRHAPGNAPNYEVHTPNAVAAARGTDYDTDYIEGEKRKGHNDCRKFTDVRVRDGVVEVWNRAEPLQRAMVRKGRKTEVPCGSIPEDPDNYSWLAGGAIAALLVGGGTAGGVFAGGGGSGASGDPPRRQPVTAAQ